MVTRPSDKPSAASAPATPPAPDPTLGPRGPARHAPKDHAAQAMERLERIARNRGWTAADLSKAMGLNVGYFSTSEDLRLGRLLEALAVAGAPPRAFFAGVFVDRVDPRDELTLERGFPPKQRHPFLRQLDDDLAPWSTRELDPNLALPSLRPEIARLEELRFYRHADARLGLEELMRRLVAQAPAEGPLPPSSLAELAVALTGWAAIQRMKGQPDTGGDALGMAFTLARRSGDFWAEGICYKRAAILVKEYGRPDLGLSWLDEASQCFLAAGHTLEQVQLLSERGALLFELGDYELAARTFEAALRFLPVGSFRYIAAAHQGLARIAREEGRREAELNHFEKALSTFPRPDYFYAHSLWGLGTVEIESGILQKGEGRLNEALHLLQQHGSYYDVGYLTLDIATIFQRRNEASKLVILAEALKPWLKTVRRERLLRELFDDFLALIELGKLDEEALRGLRARLAAAAAYARKNPR